MHRRTQEDTEAKIDLVSFLGPKKKKKKEPLEVFWMLDYEHIGPQEFQK